MDLLWSTNKGLITQKTAFFIVTAVKTSNLTSLLYFPFGLIFDPRMSVDLYRSVRSHIQDYSNLCNKADYHGRYSRGSHSLVIGRFTMPLVVEWRCYEITRAFFFMLCSHRTIPVLLCYSEVRPLKYRLSCVIVSPPLEINLQILTCFRQGIDSRHSS
jgi:hypothetical protein